MAEEAAAEEEKKEEGENGEEVPEEEEVLPPPCKYPIYYCNNLTFSSISNHNSIMKQLNQI